MRFADYLKTPVQTLAIPPSLKKSATKAALGLMGLAALPLLAGGGAALGPTIKMATALAAACALAYVCLRFLARRSQTSAVADQELKVVARASLSPKNGVALLEADGRRYLVAFGDGFATLLSNTPGVDAGTGESR